MTARSKATSIDGYIAECPAGVQAALAEIRALIKAAAPGATETMSYAIPTFDLNGKHLVHFAGYEKHVGFYPDPSGIAAFREELRPFKSAKGSVQFPLDRPLPSDLIRRMVAYRVNEVGGGADGGRVTIENVNHPGRTTTVDGRKYRAMRDALIGVLPAEAPGLTQGQMRDAVVAHLPESLFPGGATAGWWAKAVQLDLEARGVIAREKTKPLRWHRAGA
jgi:uncharacterized protein YdhG (YjbR/CyaY superfamily)